jgi:hypothetical protein
MSDSFREVTNRSWFGRLGESMKGVVIGFILFVVSFPLLWWNEGRAVDTAKALATGKGEVLDAQAQSVDPAKEGKEVHVTGEATTAETLADPEFGVSANALRLRRHAEMYQWKQDVRTEHRKKFGGGEEEVKTYTYTKTWAANPIDSSEFRESSGHTNPPMSYRSEVWQARQVKLGAYSLTDTLLNELGQGSEEPLPVKTDSAEKLPDGVRLVSGGTFYKGKDLAAPEVGDERIDFKVVKQPRTVSVLAKQTGSSFAPFEIPGRKFTIHRLMDGQKSATEMFAQMEAENTLLTWVLRLVGFLVMAVGIFLVFQPLATFADVVPFFGGLVGAGFALVAGVAALALSLLTIAVAWLFYRPLLGGSLLAAGLLLVGGLIYLGLKRRAAITAKTAV